MQLYEGIAVSPGVAIGEALVIDAQGYHIPHRAVVAEEIEQQIARFHEAVNVVATEIQEHCDKVTQELGEQYGAIFAAHFQLVRDPTLVQQVVDEIGSESCTAEFAVRRVLQRYADVFRNLESSYLAERASDIADIERRLLRQLIGEKRPELSQLDRPVLILAHDLTPGETATLDQKYVKALATEIGGSGSHTAIMANALGIPALVGAGAFLPQVSSGDCVIVDGDRAQLILDPDPQTLSRYREAAKTQRSLVKHLESLRSLPPVTLDGERIGLFSNIEFPQEVEACLVHGSDGIGLYRTEFLYLGQNQAPDEEQQYRAYCQVIEAMGNRPVTIRTVDLGADKILSPPPPGAEETERNPGLGLRSIRLSLRNLPMFRTQLRAVLRAGVRGQARIMFPMISTLNELRQAKTVLADVCEDLEEQGIAFQRDLMIGMMVEVPSVAIMIDRFISEIDFLSIGTNDLIQYSLAVDRGNKEVASLYSASDPALLQLLLTVIQTAQRSDIPVSVCGQMSANPIYTMLLLGLGLRQLSVPPSVHEEIKKVCRSVTLDRCRAVAERALQLESAREVTRFLHEELKQLCPELVP